MDRIRIKCHISEVAVELQFDLKKMPGETGPSFMVSVDGTFRGYITKTSSGPFKQMTKSTFNMEELDTMNNQLKWLLG